MTTPHATLKSWLAENHGTKDFGHSDLENLWATALNAGLDVAMHGVQRHLESLKSVPKEESPDKRLMQGAEIAAVSEVLRLLPLYRKELQAKP